MSRRVATVETETLFVRTEATTESDVLGMVPDQEDLTVTDESVDGWTKVAIEEGEGYVSNDYVTKSIEFVTAESKEEEEARLAKEEAERKAAAEAAEKAAASKKSSRSSGSSGRRLLQADPAEAQLQTMPASLSAVLMSMEGQA